jgi:hypothetical protein
VAENFVLPHSAAADAADADPAFTLRQIVAALVTRQDAASTWYPLQRALEALQRAGELQGAEQRAVFQEYIDGLVGAAATAAG